MRGRKSGTLADTKMRLSLGAGVLIVACTHGSARDEAVGAHPDATPPSSPSGNAGEGGADAGPGASGAPAAEAGRPGTRDDDPAESAGAGEASDDGTAMPYAEPTPGPETLPARAWRLGHAEYQASASALLGKAVDVSLLEPDLDNGVYPHMSASALVRVPLARSYYAQAKALTDALSEDELRALVPGGELGLAGKGDFVASAVTRAFRRPPTAAELASYGDLFELGASEGDIVGGFRAVLRALLTAPSFLYLTEIGAEPEASEFSLTDYEVASVLSYGVSGGPPDGALLESAARGELTDTAGLANALARLTAGPEAAATLGSFAEAWLTVDRFLPEASADEPPAPDKDGELFPDFDAVRGAMLAETRAFLATNAGLDATLELLLAAPVPSPKGALADFYRGDPSGAGDGTRTGVLALGTLLSLGASPSASSPTQRGHLVRERLLCQALHVPDVPPPALAAAAPRASASTTRALYEAHADSPRCAGCHALLDDVGFAFESFDAAGRFRSEEHGVAVDTSAALFGTDVDGRYADHASLARALARSEWVRECVATQAFRSYFGELEAERGIPPIQAGRQALAAGTFGDLVRALFGTRTTFRRRRQ